MNRVTLGDGIAFERSITGPLAIPVGGALDDRSTPRQVRFATLLAG